MVADPYAFNDPSGAVMGTYADPSVEFGYPGWSYQDGAGNTLATYADPSAEFGWGSPAPIWGSFNSRRAFMYGMGASEPGFWTTPKLLLVAAVAGYFLLPRGKAQALVPRFMRNPRRRRRSGRRTRRSPRRRSR